MESMFSFNSLTNPWQRTFSIFHHRNSTAYPVPQAVVIDAGQPLHHRNKGNLSGVCTCLRFKIFLVFSFVNIPRRTQPILLRALTQRGSYAVSSRDCCAMMFPAERDASGVLTPASMSYVPPVPAVRKAQSARHPLHAVQPRLTIQNSSSGSASICALTFSTITVTRSLSFRSMLMSQRSFARMLTSNENNFLRA